MAENKKSFLMYTDWIHSVRHLTNEQAGALLKHLLAYVNDENPTTDSAIINISFEPIKQQLKRDLNKYQKYIIKQTKNGKKGGRPRNPSLNQKTQALKNKPKKADNDNVTVTVNDSVTVNDNVNVINKEVDYTPVVSPQAIVKIDFNELLVYINNYTGRRFKVINDSVRKKYKARLKEGFTNKDIGNAIRNAVQADYHQSNGNQYLTPEFFSRADTLNKYSFKSESNDKSNKQNLAQRVNKAVDDFFGEGR